MIQLTISNFIIYIILTWGPNISLNLLYVVKKYYPFFKKYDKPIDGGFVFYGNNLIGDSTTILGLFLSIIVSIFFYVLFSNIELSIIPILVYLGHMFGSFIKRRMNKKDGVFVPFLDHGDYMIFSGLILVLIKAISWQLALAGLLFTYMFHPLACILAFRLKMREYPY